MHASPPPPSLSEGDSPAPKPTRTRHPFSLRMPCHARTVSSRHLACTSDLPRAAGPATSWLSINQDLMLNNLWYLFSMGCLARYTALLDRLDSVPMNELVMAIRRTSPGFTRGSSSFRGVTQHKSGAQTVPESLICPHVAARMQRGHLLLLGQGIIALLLHIIHLRGSPSFYLWRSFFLSCLCSSMSINF